MYSEIPGAYIVLSQRILEGRLPFLASTPAQEIEFQMAACLYLGAIAPKENEKGVSLLLKKLSDNRGNNLEVREKSDCFVSSCSAHALSQLGYAPTPTQVWEKAAQKGHIFASQLRPKNNSYGWPPRPLPQLFDFMAPSSNIGHTLPSAAGASAPDHPKP